ncbi:MAG TPA: membrane protein insertase YidC [Candidatus Acidoferrales bacterium]|nr:membrane protein insertase YidC [Candidatus Acidoferrales bacterium]
MSEQKEGLSHEMRTLLAAVLTMAVIIGFSYLYKPSVPQRPPQNQNSPVTGSPAQNSTPPASAQIGSQITGLSPQHAVPSQPLAATSERTVVVESPLYRVELSNRGAVVRSWQLNKYKDDSNPPRTLDVVHTEASQQFGWPLSVMMEDASQQDTANTALYQVTTGGSEGNSSGVLTAPVEVDFNWSNGHLAVTKKLKFDSSYIASFSIDTKLDGQSVPFGVGWLGGFGDNTVYQPTAHTQVFYSLEGKLKLLTYKNLGQPKQPDQRQTQAGPLDFAGIEDSYFAAAFLPPIESAGPHAGQPNVLGASMTLADWTLSHDVQNADGKTEKDYVPEMAVSSARGEPINLRLMVAPKDLDQLKTVRPPLNELVQFGWLTIIAEPLFYLLLWMHKYISNYGWAIVVMTIGLNMVLLPLRIRSQRSMQKMQKVGPEVRAIQDRYKKYSMRDPRKAKMNEEVMAVYSREGINPLGGCLPMALQMPIWYGLYRMLTVTIELRHAPWIGWIHDLSARDSYYILPILMAITMYIAQKMTPTPTTDASQQRMMALMPIMFGGMFIVFPVASGLVLYILTSNVVNMVQQWFLNRTAPMPAPAKGPRKKS